MTEGQIERCCEALEEALQGDGPERSDPLRLSRWPASPTLHDDLFRRLNASIGFDRRLWPQDVAGSRAHVEALATPGC